MPDKSHVQEPPKVGTCCALINPEKVQVGPREYIYNLLPPTLSQVPPQKIPPLVRRRDPPPLPDAVPKAPHQSMGPPLHPHPKKYELPEKYPFNKKHWRTPFIERKCLAEKVRLATNAFEKLKTERPTGRVKDACCAGSKAPVPTTRGLRYNLDADGIPQRCKGYSNIHRTNWIERNAIEAITCKPGTRQAHPQYRFQVDMRNGEARAIDSSKTHSGMEKRYVYKPAYGKVPKYLKLRAAAIEETRELYSRYLNEKALQCTDHMLSEKERLDLLNGLKAAWDRYNAIYLGLSASSTTLKNKTYKEYLERQLESLEKDIEQISSHPFIFIDADKKPGVGGEVTAGLRV